MGARHGAWCVAVAVARWRGGACGGAWRVLCGGASSATTALWSVSPVRCWSTEASTSCQPDARMKSICFPPESRSHAWRVTCNSRDVSDAKVFTATSLHFAINSKRATARSLSAAFISTAIGTAGPISVGSLSDDMRTLASIPSTTRLPGRVCKKLSISASTFTNSAMERLACGRCAEMATTSESTSTATHLRPAAACFARFARVACTTTAGQRRPPSKAEGVNKACAPASMPSKWRKPSCKHKICQGRAIAA